MRVLVKDGTTQELLDEVNLSEEFIQRHEVTADSLGISLGSFIHDYVIKTLDKRTDLKNFDIIILEYVQGEKHDEH